MTVRIDTFRNQIAATIELLRMVQAEAEDLHALAYDRPRAVGEKVRRSGGDWSLDNHGDTRARDAYRELSEALVTAAMDIATKAHDCRGLLREGEPTGSRSYPRVTPIELAEAIAARDHGDYTAVRTNAQPAREKALKAITDDRDRLKDLVMRCRWEIPTTYRDKVEDPDDRDLLAEIKRMARAIEKRERRRTA